MKAAHYNNFKFKINTEEFLTLVLRYEIQSREIKRNTLCIYLFMLNWFQLVAEMNNK